MPLEVVWFQRVKMLISVKSILFLYITYLFTSWEANRFSGSQEISHILCKPMVCYHIHKCLPSVPILTFVSLRTVLIFKILHLCVSVVENGWKIAVMKAVNVLLTYKEQLCSCGVKINPPHSHHFYLDKMRGSCHLERWFILASIKHPSSPRYKGI